MQAALNTAYTQIILTKQILNMVSIFETHSHFKTVLHIKIHSTKFKEYCRDFLKPSVC
jgi:hypothetical protein